MEKAILKHWGGQGGGFLLLFFFKKMSKTALITN